MAQSRNRDRLNELINTNNPAKALTWAADRPAAQGLRWLDTKTEFGNMISRGLFGEASSFLILIQALVNGVPDYAAAKELCEQTIGRVRLYRQMLGGDNRVELESVLKLVQAIAREL